MAGKNKVYEESGEFNMESNWKKWESKPIDEYTKTK